MHTARLCWFLFVIGGACAAASCGGGTTEPECVGQVPGTRLVDPARTDTVRAADGRADLIIPAGALPTRCLAYVSMGPTDNLPDGAAQRLAIVPATGVAVTLQYGEGFRVPVTLIVRYDPAALPSGAGRSDLRVAHVVYGECLMRDYIYGCVLHAADTLAVRGGSVLAEEAREVRLAEADTLHYHYALVVPAPGAP
jgi:hypothetical protein